MFRILLVVLVYSLCGVSCCLLCLFIYIRLAIPYVWSAPCATGIVLLHALFSCVILSPSCSFLVPCKISRFDREKGYRSYVLQQVQLTQGLHLLTLGEWLNLSSKWMEESGFNLQKTKIIQKNVGKQPSRHQGTSVKAQEKCRARTLTSLKHFDQKWRFLPGPRARSKARKGGHTASRASPNGNAIGRSCPTALSSNTFFSSAKSSKSYSLHAGVSNFTWLARNTTMTAICGLQSSCSTRVDGPWMFEVFRVANKLRVPLLDGGGVFSSCSWFEFLVVLFCVEIYRVTLLHGCLFWRQQRDRWTKRESRPRDWFSILNSIIQPLLPLQFQQSPSFALHHRRRLGDRLLHLAPPKHKSSASSTTFPPVQPLSNIQHGP